MKKLSLNKKTIANLENSEKIYGGTNTCWTKAPIASNCAYDTCPMCKAITDVGPECLTIF